MRTHLVNAVERYAETHGNVIIVTADLGYSVLERFRDRFPDRFFNVGISEQNMASVCAGLAVSGFKVIMYSIGNFTTLRCLEQIRNCICYHNADVKIVSVGGGFAYGALGMSHHSTEDVGIMRTLPNMKVYAPADPVFAEMAIEDALSFSGPAYIRLERNNEKQLDIRDRSVDVTEVRRGKRIAIFSYGSIVNEAIAAGNDTGVYSILKLKDLNESKCVEFASGYDFVISLEEHNRINGLGYALSYVFKKYEVPCRLISMGLDDEYTSVVGDQAFLRHHYKLDAAAINEVIAAL